DIGATTPSLARLSAVPAPGEQQHLALRPAPQDQGKTHSSNGAAGPLSDPPADAEVLRYRADLARVRSFAAAWAARAGLPPHGASGHHNPRAPAAQGAAVTDSLPHPGLA